MSKFIPPTIEEVLERIREKGWYTVSAQEFLDVNEGNDWTNPKTLRPYVSWRGVLATWYHKSLEWGSKPKLCRICRKYGCYPGKDDTGQQYWLCEDHKSKPKKLLPDEMTDGLFRVVYPKVDVNERRNQARKGLGI